MKALIENVLLEGKKTSVLVEGNRIASIGKEKDSSDEVIDGSSLAIAPSFVNCHAHAAMSLLRGYADDFPLQEWLQKYIWPVEAKVTKKDVYWGSKLACLEMIKTGTTCFADMYFFPEETARAAKESGIRAFPGIVFLGKEKIDAGKVKNQVKELGSFGERIRPMLAPHAMYTVSEENLRIVAEISEKENLPVHFHLSETEKEVRDCVKEHGKRPVEWLEKIGFLNERVLNAHSVWLDRKEIRVLAKSRAKAVHCPSSNLKLAVGGVFPYCELKKAGVEIALGTDGCASNNSLSMLSEMKFASLLQKHDCNDTTVMPAKEAFSIATEGGAKALGLDAGAIKEGMLADFMLVDLKNFSLVPGHSLISDLVYSASDSCVDTVFCNGEIVMRHGKVEGEEEIIEKAKAQAMDWTGR
ncbi:MAG: amidohydrolase [Candidatus Diapherotrites archaeon]|nr:amidohydrolase [Candidatus Diapherotrites archaeon]